MIDMSSQVEKADSFAAVPAEKLPLCVDLDGTLVRTDLLWESLLSLVHRSPASIFQFPMWLSRGKAYFKERVAERAEVDCSVLPFRASVLECLEAARKEGRQTALVTASTVKLANQVADHLKLFDVVIASDGARNNSAENKRDALVERFGEHGFVYAGDAAADLPVFEAARESIFVGTNDTVRKKAANVAKVLDDEPASPRVFVKLLRIHQWAKNLLIFLPLLASHQVRNPGLLGKSIVAFLVFGFVASGIYIVNDLFDLTSDRHHPKKRFRPLASGRVKIPTAIAISATLLIVGLGGSALLLPWGFLAWLGLYMVMTTAYTLGLKRRIIADVIVLAALYCVRIVAGGAATGIQLTHWLLAFSMFMFISLAFVKRYTEAAMASTSNSIRGRGYRRSDLDIIRVVGPCSGLMSILIIALYINDPDTLKHYRSPEVLWLLCPVLMYWVTRIWFLAHRNELHHDPLVFALRDWRSHVVAVACLVILALATVIH
jgi:4-hydroxybenzoate polyprenyltransferase/phosphoserine phosphatase